MVTELFQRLPKLCLPVRYAIELRPCLKTFTFTGKQSVSLNITEGTSEIVLNAKKLTIYHAKFNGSPVEVIHKPDAEKVVIPLKVPCLAGSATLDLEFKGEISDKMTGLYKSTYVDDNKEKVMLSTHFEPSCARQAFPCWDEPEFKSVFSLTLVVPKKLTAISNMPVASETELDDHLISYQFEDTPKMSTYLVAFAIGELEFVETRDSDNVLIRVYSRPGMVSELDRGQLALETAAKSLPFFGDYFGIRYPLPKVDLLAVPDFAGGAMENWGLVTFRERCLLVEKDSASPSSKQNVALVISHELAHMWFGNLVTMRWWTDLWLKEGFATWIEYLCVNHCFPEMQIWTHFTFSEMASALRLDSLVNSHPIEVEVTNPDEIDEIFDTISYCKGASLIHMVHAFLGDEAFRKGLCSYLAKHAYSNATTDDLWSALEGSSGMHVASIMSPWTKTAGFPVVSIKPLRVQDNQLLVQLEQMQYRLPSGSASNNGTTINGSSKNHLWPVPVTMTCYTKDGKHHFVHKHILTESTETVTIPLADWSLTSVNDCLIQMNVDATGFYHCRYSDDQLKGLVQHANQLGWTIPTKVAFINDGFALAKAGFIRVSDWLSVIPQLLTGEMSYPVWRSVLVDGLGTYVSRLVHEGEISIPAYKAFLRSMAMTPLEKLGFFNSSQEANLSHDEHSLRSLLVLAAGAEAGDPKVIAEAQRRFEAHHSGSDTNAIPGSLRSAIYTTVVRNSKEDVLDRLMQNYRIAKSPEERSHILSALGAATMHVNPDSTRAGDPAEPSTPLSRVLRFCLDPNGPVRDQDRVPGLVACASWSSGARLITWEAVKNDWPHLAEVYRGQFLLASLIKGVLCGFATEPRIKDVKEFFDRNPVTCPRALLQVHETMETNRLLLERDGPLIAQALKQLAPNV